MVSCAEKPSSLRCPEMLTCTVDQETLMMLPEMSTDESGCYIRQIHFDRAALQSWANI